MGLQINGQSRFARRNGIVSKEEEKVVMREMSEFRILDEISSKLR